MPTINGHERDVDRQSDADDLSDDNLPAVQLILCAFFPVLERVKVSSLELEKYVKNPTCV